MCTISFIFRSETLIRLGEMCPNITSLSLICCDENYRKNHYMWSYMRDCSFISAFPALNSLYLFRTLVKLITCFHKFLNVRIQDYFFHNFFPTRQKFSIEIKNADITVYHNRKRHLLCSRLKKMKPKISRKKIVDSQIQDS